MRRHWGLPSPYGADTVPNLRAWAMLFHQIDNHPLHSVGHGLTNYRDIELILVAGRQNFALCPGLVHLVSSQFKNQRARSQQTLVQSRA
jgi:hypothetical protein